MAAAIGFGTLGPVSRLASDAGLGTLGFITWRSGLGGATILLAFSAVVVAGRARFPRRADIARADRRTIVTVALAGAATNLAVFIAFSRTTVAVALICFYTYPAIVTLVAARRYGETLDRIRLGALALAFGGLLLVVVAPLIGSNDVQLDAVGIALALLGACFQAIYALTAGRGFGAVPTALSTGLIVGFAGVTYLAISVVSGQFGDVLAPFRQPDLWPYVLAGAIVGAAVPTVLFMNGLGRVGPVRTAIVMMLEPVAGVVIAALLLDQVPTPLQVVGGAAVIVAGVLLQLPQPGERLPAEGAQPTI